MGTRTLIAHLFGISLGVVTPYMRRPSPAARYAMSTPSCTSPRVSMRILPISRVAACASISLFYGDRLAEAVEQLATLRRRA
jgi:hypothetical protein